jgi:hypothetical protein
MKNFFDHMRDGVSQSERRLDALMPANLRIDERTQDDLLLFLSEIAGQFNYYNLYNDREGSWQEFFSADLQIVLLSISKLDFTSYQDKYQQIQEQLQVAEGDAALRPILSIFFNMIYEIALLLQEKLNQVSVADHEKETGEYDEHLSESISGYVYRLLLYEKQASQLFQHKYDLRTSHTDKLVKELFASAYEKSLQDDTEDMFLGYQSLNEIYTGLRSRFYQVASASKQYLDRKILPFKHQPHIGLIKAFTGLYGHMQEHLNHFTERHLDYYYKNVLGIQLRPAIPDQVHLCIEALPQTLPVTIPRDTLFPAGDTNFRLTHDLKLSQTKIKALRTVFISDYKQISAHDLRQSDIMEAQIYKASYDVLPAAAFLPESVPVKAWALGGEDQHELPDNQRTMQEADIGFILASPVLNLTEGYRTIVISIYFEPVSFAYMRAYVKNYAQVKQRREETILNELLAAAFLISYTTATGWEDISRHTIKINLDEKLNCININITLEAAEPPFSIYVPLIHGDAYETKQPLVKLLLNNYSFHNAFSFMRSLEIERIAINANVKGYKSVHLYNNVGPLSAENPFQMFGPQPVIGTYLDIRNSNIFNRYTKDFTIGIEWLDVPNTEGGFNTYYDAYNAGFKNESFKIKISNGYMQADKDLPLFETYRDADGKVFLNNTTKLKQADFQRLLFNNSPSTDGMVRVELSAPQEAFGQRLYTQLFPEIVTHNAGRWVKKRPLPNMPYTPMVKSITLDYTLEQAEILKSDKDTSEGNGIQIFHLYPFGFRQAYPSAGHGSFFLLPQFEGRSNLYIGFDNLQPGENISLLFQLEDKYYTHTTGNRLELQWNYLHNDKWIPFDKSQVITDSTHQFISSGIIQLRMPDLTSFGNTRLDPSLQWINLSSAYSLDTRPMVKGIFMNAGIADRQLDNTTTVTNITPLTIKTAATEIRGVQRIWQLFPSFGGRSAEAMEEYYIRVSERLRHKKRPVLGIDIIQLVLEQFPEIHIAKCMGNDPDEPGDMMPDTDLQLVVVPKIQNSQVEEPRADLAALYRIKEYLEELLPDYMKIAVHNPVYERVKVICDVHFGSSRSSTDNNYYLSMLQEDIRKYLNPWLFDADSQVKIGSELYKSEMLNFIKKLPYVTYVTAFSIVHFFREKDPLTGNYINCIQDTAVEDIEFIEGSMPEAVLIPASHHLITVIDEKRYRDPQPMGIDSVITGEEMIIVHDRSSSHKKAVDSAGPNGEMITLTIHSK